MSEDILQQILSEMKSMRSEMDQRFAGIDKRFAGIDKRFAGIDKRFDEMDQRFVSIDERFNEMDQRLAKVEENTALIPAIQQAVFEMAGSIKTLEEKDKERDFEIQVLNNRVFRVEKEIERLTKQA